MSFVDREAEGQLVRGLTPLLPGAKFLAEEAHQKTRTNTETYLWVIDPLDGTTNFVHHLQFYCVSVALLRKGQPLLGIIYDVCNKDCYWAVKGEGAFANTVRLKVSETKRIEDSLLAVGFFSKDLESAAYYSKALSQLSVRARGWRRMGSAALQMAYVAAGRFDAYMDTQLKAWDIAAGLLLIEEAGGRLTDLSGMPFDITQGELLAGGAAHADFLRFMQQI